MEGRAKPTERKEPGTLWEEVTKGPCSIVIFQVCSQQRTLGSAPDTATYWLCELEKAASEPRRSQMRMTRNLTHRMTGKINLADLWEVLKTQHTVSAQ